MAVLQWAVLLLWAIRGWHYARAQFHWLVIVAPRLPAWGKETFLRHDEAWLSHSSAWEPGLALEGPATLLGQEETLPFHSSWPQEILVRFQNL